MADFLSYMTCTSWIISVLETCSSTEPIKSAIKHCQMFNKAAGKYVLILHAVPPVQNNINGYDYYQESIMTKPRPRNDDDPQFTSVETIERLQQNGVDISALYDRGVIPPVEEIMSEEEDSSSANPPSSSTASSTSASSTSASSTYIAPSTTTSSNRSRINTAASTTTSPNKSWTNTASSSTIANNTAWSNTADYGSASNRQVSITVQTGSTPLKIGGISFGGNIETRHFNSISAARKYMNDH